MYIQNLNIINFNNNYKPTVQKENSSNRYRSLDLNSYSYYPFFNNKINFKGGFYIGKTTSENTKILQKTLQTLLTPMKKDFIIMKKGAIIDNFNQFYNLEYGKMSMVAEPDFKFVFKDFVDKDSKDEQFSVRVIDLDKGEFDFGFFDEKNNLQRIKLKGNQFYSLEDTKNPISYSNVLTLKLEDKFNNMLPVITQGIDKINDIVESVFKHNKKGYAMFLTKGIKKRFNAINEILGNIEPEKRYALKRSYPNFIPFPNKSALFLKESDKLFAERLAFIPHRKGDNKTFRIVKFDSNSNILDAYLIDTEKGVYKNFCKRKIFNLKNISLIPKDDTKMTSSEINDTELIPMLEKYYFLIDDFVDYTQKNSSKSAKVLLEGSKSKNYLPYNMIKQNFINRLKYVLPENEKELSFISPNNEIYSLKKGEIDGRKIIKVSRESEKGTISVFLDEASSKILDTQAGEKLIYDKQGNPKNIPHSSDSFKTRSRILQEFIDIAFEQKKFMKNENFANTLINLKEEFSKISQAWFSTYKNKKTEVRSLFGDGLIASKGDAGGFRFKIPNKEYSIGLKPHQIGKEQFMRLTIYNTENEITENFLLDNFSKIVDNYCAQGKYTKDAISRVPENIIYKTDDQIQSTNIQEYCNEYLAELKRFGEVLFENLTPKAKLTS